MESDPAPLIEIQAALPKPTESFRAWAETTNHYF